MSNQHVPLRVRFESGYMPVSESGCWLWMRFLEKGGYGLIHSDHKAKRAHRVGYELYRGQIPQGLTLDHLCRVRCCVNPWHLEAVTIGQNVLRGAGFPAVNLRKTHCMHGHALDGANVYTNPATRHRHCRVCARARDRKRYHKRYYGVPRA